MALKLQAKLIAPGGPGIEPRSTRGAKVAGGTAYSTSSRVWYTSQFTTVTFDIRGWRKTIEVWKFNRQVQVVEADTILRIQANAPFLLHWTKDDWRRSGDTPSITTAVGLNYADIPVPNGAISLQFTFLSVDEDRWEGKEYKVQVRAGRRVPLRVKLRLTSCGLVVELLTRSCPQPGPIMREIPPASHREAGQCGLSSMRR